MNSDDFRSILHHMAMQQAFKKAAENLIAGDRISAQSTQEANDLRQSSEYDPI